VLKLAAHTPAVESKNATDFADRFVDAADDVTGDAVVDDFRDGTLPECQHRCAAGHGLDHDQPEWLRPIDREEERLGLAQESILMLLTDLTDELDARLLQEWCNLAKEVGLVGTVDLGRNPQRQTNGSGNLNGPVDALLRRNAPEESKVPATGAQRRREEITGNTVQNGADEV
jgi:hypothetical protein